jgi:hypothetical protein
MEATGLRLLRARIRGRGWNDIRGRYAFHVEEKSAVSLGQRMRSCPLRFLERAHSTRSLTRYAFPPVEAYTLSPGSQESRRRRLQQVHRALHAPAPAMPRPQVPLSAVACPGHRPGMETEDPSRGGLRRPRWLEGRRGRRRSQGCEPLHASSTTRCRASDRKRKSRARRHARRSARRRATCCSWNATGCSRCAILASSLANVSSNRSDVRISVSLEGYSGAGSPGAAATSRHLAPTEPPCINPEPAWKE